MSAVKLEADGYVSRGIVPCPPFFAAIVRALLCLLALGGVNFDVESTSAQAQIANNSGSPKVSRYTNMDAPGHDLRWQRGIASTDQCEGLCLADTACAGYTFNTTKNACFLKSSIGPMSASQDPAVTGVLERKPQQAMTPEPGWQAGNSSRDAAYNYGAPKVSRYTNMDAPGHDLRWQRGIASADQCEGLCIADTACAGYTFNTTKNACFLKSAIGQMSASQDPAVTGVVDRKQQQAMAPELNRQLTNSSRDLEFSTWMSENDYNKLAHDMAQQRQYPILLEAKVVNNGLIYRSAFDPYPYPAFSYTTLTGGIPSIFAEDELKSRQNGFVLSYRQSVFLNGQERIQAVWLQGSPSAQANTAADAKPSFDCSRASVASEWAICGSLSLSRLDAQMSQLYWARAAQLQGAGAADDQNRRQSWLLARNACGANIFCLEQMYNQRIAELSSQQPLAISQPAPVQPPPVQPSPLQQAALPERAPQAAQPVQTAVSPSSNDADNAPSSLKRVALVVGNSAYKSVSPLTNPAHDATLIGKTLQGLGFELVGGSAQLDLDKAGFDEAVQNFGKQMQGADVGLFYYAGHGIQVHGENYLVPVSANPVRETDVDFQMLDMNLVLKQMEGAGTRLNLVLVDACRNNPFGGRGLRAAGGGLARVNAPKGTLISFATDPGNVAQDGEDGDSPYTKALAQAMKKPGLGLFDVFNEVGLSVEKQTGGTQQPWVSHSPIAGSFYFAGAPAGQMQLAMAEPEPLSRSALPAAPAPAPLTRSTSAAPPQDVAMIAPPQANTTQGPAPETECDRLAASRFDTDKPPGVPGVETEKIDIQGAITACRAAIDQYPQDRRLIFELGRVLQISRQFDEAAPLYRKAAEAGHTTAMVNLGFLLRSGLGTTKDEAEAVGLYRKAADAGNMLALENLGVMYASGRGLPKDEAEAARLYRQAADAGVAGAMNRLGEMYEKGNGVAKNATEAARYYLQAAEAGNVPAMRNLGELYQQGSGFTRDLSQARLWYQKAADLGDETAKKALKTLHGH